MEDVVVVGNYITPESGVCCTAKDLKSVLTIEAIEFGLCGFSQHSLKPVSIICIGESPPGRGRVLKRGQDGSLVNYFQRGVAKTVRSQGPQGEEGLVR